MRRIWTPNPRTCPPAARRGRAIAPIGGTTLLVLVTLVLATGQRDTLPIRQAAADARWAEPATTRESRDIESRPSEPTKPAAPKFFGAGQLSTRLVSDLLLEVASTPRDPGDAKSCSPRIREALLNLPPPQA